VTSRRGLLDTSTVVHLADLDDVSVLPDEPVVSTITLAELSVGPLVSNDDAERAIRQAHLQQAESDFDAVPFDETAARAFGQVATDLRRAGRKTSARAFDALIAAVAIANDLPLYTVNPQDFRHITGLNLVDVPHPDQDS
jgi:predicted nucleic acid-binding protein